MNIPEIVKSLFGSYVGYAVEAGAFDGVFESTTYELEKIGWKVLLIEPIPSAFDELLKNRKNDYCLQYALGSCNEDNVNFEVYDMYGGASISSLSADKHILEVFNPNLLIPKTNISVRKRTLDSCLEEVNFPKLDILSLDVEGSEKDVLEGFTIDK